jgi:alpha-glucosidase
MPPRWALGYHQARWSYASAGEVRDVAAALRDHDIPADAIHLDIDHMDRFRPFTWDPERFPDPRALVSHLREHGLRTTLVVDAAVPVADGYDVYEDGRRGGCLVRRSRDPDAEEFTAYLWGGISAFPDHTRPDVRRWWGDLYARYLDAGVAGFLNDMNEPAMHDRPFDDPDSANTEPPPGTPFGEGDDVATHAEVRNVYGLLEDRAADEGIRRARPEARPFLISRAGFAGVQRHAMIWTGDNWSTWEHLEMSLPQLVNLGLSGVPLAGADIGGFFDSCTPELLVRWTQLGALYPFARNNSAEGTPHQEPWAFGEPTTSRCRRAIELRYRLLPYLYTVVEEASRTGWPVLRPLFFEYPDDGRAQVIGDEALVGRDLLIAPVTRPGQAARSVYLPPGRWLDLRDGTVHDAGDVLVRAGLDEDPPLFLRAGAMLPMGPVMRCTDERPIDPLTLHAFPDGAGHAAGTLYEDDGASNAYRAGGWCRTVFEAHVSGSDLVVRVRRDPAGSFVPAGRAVEVVLHGPRGAQRETLDDSGDWELTLPWQPR